MANIAIQDFAFASPAAITFGAAAANDTIPVSAGERIALLVKNDSGGSINVTIAAQVTSANVQGAGAPLTIANKVVAVASGAIVPIPIPQAFVGDDGLADISWSATASVTRAAIRFNATL